MNIINIEKNKKKIKKRVDILIFLLYNELAIRNNA